MVVHKNIWIPGELSVTVLSFVGSLLSGRALELSKTSRTAPLFGGQIPGRNPADCKHFF
jgi:hypothetical protein